MAAAVIYKMSQISSKLVPLPMHSEDRESRDLGSGSDFFKISSTDFSRTGSTSFRYSGDLDLNSSNWFHSISLKLLLTSFEGSGFGRQAGEFNYLK